MAESRPRSPLIVVIGASGTGKSKLAVSLAKKYNGEIINADAIQMYKGLPIVTNKIPEAEREGISHHLLDLVSLEDKPWTVREFVRSANRTVAQIRAKGRLPIIVGGTSYYVHGLLFPNTNLVSSGGGRDIEESEERSQMSRASSLVSDLSILDSSTADLYAKLMELDPELAKKWHPNERRKIQRSLEIYLKTGKKASELYASQKQPSMDNGIAKERELEDKPLIFWLEAEDAVLKERLNKRVDTMVEHGLLAEVSEMRAYEMESMKQGVFVDKSSGIWVAIGYKELEPYLDALANGSIIADQLDQIKLACLEDVRAGTRRYAKRQNRYIRLRLSNALREAQLENNMFLLDCTNVSAFAKNVEEMAGDILKTYLDGDTLPNPKTLSTLATQMFAQMETRSVDSSDQESCYCEHCKKTMMSTSKWHEHLKSNSHKKVMQSIKKRAQKEEYMVQRNAREIKSD